MDEHDVIKKTIAEVEETDNEQDFGKEEINDMKDYEAEKLKLLPKDSDFNQINYLYDECLNYLKGENVDEGFLTDSLDPDYESIKDKTEFETKDEVKYEIDDRNESNVEEINNIEHKIDDKLENKYVIEDKNESKHVTETEKAIVKIVQPKMIYKVENELKSNESIDSTVSENRSERLRKFSQQLPKIIITQSNTSLNVRRHDDVVVRYNWNLNHEDVKKHYNNNKKEVKPKNEKARAAFENNTQSKKPLHRSKAGYGDFPKRLVSKKGVENVACISNVPFEKIRMLNDTFHTLINLRWRWIVSGTVVVHFAIWLVFAVFWYIAALAHYDFEPEPPHRPCITGGHDFLTIFLASVEAQTTIGFGDRAIDEECPESIFLFIMQLILGTGLSGVLTCVVYAKLTRPEKLSRDGVGFSKKAVLSMRDGRLCLMLRAWDLNYDHVISSEFTAHFVHTYRTKEGETIRYYAQNLALQQRQFLLWPVTLVHVIDESSPLYRYGPEHISNSNYEITVSLKGASASMGTFTQSQTSYLPKEVLWGHRFPSVVKYDCRKHKYVIDHKKLDETEPVDTPFCSAEELYHTPQDRQDPGLRPATPNSFSDQISSFQLGRSSSFRKKTTKG